LLPNCIGGVMVIVLTSIAVDRVLELRSGQTKNYKIQWDDDDVRLVLDQHAELDCYSASTL
jgi:hypothetical protein